MLLTTEQTTGLPDSSAIAAAATAVVLLLCVLLLVLVVVVVCSDGQSVLAGGHGDRRTDRLTNRQQTEGVVPSCNGQTSVQPGSQTG